MGALLVVIAGAGCGAAQARAGSVEVSTMFEALETIGGATRVEPQLEVMMEQDTAPPRL